MNGTEISAKSRNIAPSINTAEETIMSIEHLNPESMHKNPAFSQGIIVPAGARTLVIGGQNAVNKKGEVVGKGDMAAQTTQALDNLITVLETAGGSLNDLIRVGIYFRADGDIAAGFGAWMKRAGAIKNPPAVVGVKVAGLAHPTTSSKSKPPRFCRRAFLPRPSGERSTRRGG
jgi:enamine deaminase RidA (YjgF/YER057c/UK114 family)